MSTDKILCWVYKNCYKKAIVKDKVLAGMSAFFNKKNSHYIYLNKASCYRLFQLLKENKAWWKKKKKDPPYTLHFLSQEHTVQEKSFNMQTYKTNTGGSSWNDMPGLVSLALSSKSLKRNQKNNKTQNQPYDKVLKYTKNPSSWYSFQNKYVQHINMQYAKALCCCWQHLCPPHPYSHVYLYCNTITSLSLLVWKGNLIHLKLVNFCVGAPFVWLRIVDFNRVQEFIAIKPPNGIDSVCHRGDASVAPGSRHAAHHLPLVPRGVVHLHTAHRMRAIKASANKELSYQKETKWMFLCREPAALPKAAAFLGRQTQPKRTFALFKGCGYSIDLLWVSCSLEPTEAISE